MVRVETEVPTEWKKKLKQIGKEKGNTSTRQLLRDAIYNMYIKPSKKQPESQ